MAKLWTVIKREYLERVRARWFIFATIFAPVFLIALVIVPALLASRNKENTALYNTTVIDATDTGLGEAVALTLGGGRHAYAPMPEVRVVPPAALTPAESLATREVMQKKASGYLVIDHQTVAGEKARYAGRLASSVADMERIRSAIKENVLALRLQQEGIDPSRTEALSFVPLSLDTDRITDRGHAGSGMVNLVFAVTVAFLLYTSILIYGQAVLRSVLEEKTTRIAEIIISSVSADTLLAGKVIGVGAVGLTQQLIWAATALAAVKLRGPILSQLGVAVPPVALPDVSLAGALVLLLFFVLGFTFYAALYAAAGAMVNSEQEAQQVAQPLALLQVSTVVFVQAILLNPTTQLARVMSWLPFSAPIIMPVRLATTYISPLEIALTLAALAASCAASIWLSARIYRVGLLMYGKRPSLRELGRWIHYSS